MSILQPEASIWYAICWVVVGARFLAKRLRVGSWRKLQVDDYLVVPTMITLTALVALLHIIAKTNSNLIAPGDDIAKFTPEDFQERIYGSKLTIISEQMHILTIWTLKACILIMYSRMTDLLRLRIYVKAAAGYVGLAFATMEILWFGVWCRPFNSYWAVPTKPQCSSMINHLITNAVLNISSDIVIMVIPLPLVFKIKIPIKNKLVLGGLLSVGIFTIFAAAMNKYESFKNPFSTDWMIWYLREAFTAVLCANLPLTRPLLQRLFHISAWSYSVSTGDHYDNSRPSHWQRSTVRQRSYPLAGISTTVSRGHTRGLSSMPQFGSEEHINQQAGPMEILYETEVRIERYPPEGLGSDSQSILEGGNDDRSEKRDRKSPDAVSTISRPKSVVTTCYHDVHEGSSGYSVQR